MNVEVLQKLFRGIPESVVYDLGGKLFSTVWYAASGIDMSVVSIFDPWNPRAIIEEKDCRVFFYTDNAYRFNDTALVYENKEYDFLTPVKGCYQKNTRAYSGQLNEGKIYSNIFSGNFFRHQQVKLLTVKSEDGETNLYVFFIRMSNELFEGYLNIQNISIDIVCHAGGYGSIISPQRLGNLNVKYGLGYPIPDNSEHIDESVIKETQLPIIPFSSKHIATINWGLAGTPENSLGYLRKIIIHYDKLYSL